LMPALVDGHIQI